MHYRVAGIMEKRALSLTVDVNVAADVGAAKRVGDLAGHGLCEEGVVHDNLVRVSRDLLDYAPSFGPPGARIRKQRKKRRWKKNEGRGEEALRQVFTPPYVNSILLCE